MGKTSDCPVQLIAAGYYVPHLYRQALDVSTFSCDIHIVL